MRFVDSIINEHQSINQNGVGQNGVGQNGVGQKGIGQNGTDKMVAIFIDSNSTELNFYSVTTSHKITDKPKWV